MGCSDVPWGNTAYGSDGGMAVFLEQSGEKPSQMEATHDVRRGAHCQTGTLRS